MGMFEDVLVVGFLHQAEIRTILFLFLLLLLLLFIFCIYYEVSIIVVNAIQGLIEER